MLFIFLSSIYFMPGAIFAAACVARGGAAIAYRQNLMLPLTETFCGKSIPIIFLK